jgi:predicted regulator of Ras-like GTPase activity (Roadblock/LC7/MglB family)
LQKQKTGNNEAETVLNSAAVVTAVEDENSVFANLSTSLAEIRKLKGVIGYILRNNSSAVIDLNESDKIIPYATLASQVHESCKEIARLFSMGETESMLVEGENVKVLCMNLGENRISVFMEISATHAWIIKRILL